LKNDRKKRKENKTKEHCGSPPKAKRDTKRAMEEQREERNQRAVTSL
jgi:hypothetical protein